MDNIKKAWKCILTDKYINLCKKESLNFPGINIFSFLRETRDKTNCYYYYSSKESMIYNNILKEFESIKNKYDPSNHLLICIEVPKGEFDDKIVKDVKLINIESEIIPKSFEKSETHNLYKRK